MDSIQIAISEVRNLLGRHPVGSLLILFEEFSDSPFWDEEQNLDGTDSELSDSLGLSLGLIETLRNLNAEWGVNHSVDLSATQADQLRQQIKRELRPDIALEAIHLTGWVDDPIV